MGWVSITLACLAALAALFLLLAYLLRFRYVVEIDFPRVSRASFEISFLWIRKVFPFGGSGDAGEGGDEAASEDGGPGPAREVIAAPGQAGFLRIELPLRWRIFRRRLMRAGRRWIVDIPVWKILAGYLLRSAARLYVRLRPACEFLHVSMEDVVTLGRIAGAWSSLRGAFPSLAGPVEYGFNRPFALRLKLAGGSSALGLLFLAAALLITFPWVALGARFLHCWRHPGLNRWQRRVLLS